MTFRDADSSHELAESLEARLDLLVGEFQREARGQSAQVPSEDAQVLIDQPPQADLEDPLATEWEGPEYKELRKVAGTTRPYPSCPPRFAKGIL